MNTKGVVVRVGYVFVSVMEGVIWLVAHNEGRELAVSVWMSTRGVGVRVVVVLVCVENMISGDTGMEEGVGCVGCTEAVVLEEF